MLSYVSFFLMTYLYRQSCFIYAKSAFLNLQRNYNNMHIFSHGYNGLFQIDEVCDWLNFIIVLTLLEQLIS